MQKRIECKCGKSFIVLDSTNVDMPCGVVGLVGLTNVYVSSGVVNCAERNCGNELYRQTAGV